MHHDYVGDGASTQGRVTVQISLCIIQQRFWAEWRTLWGNIIDTWHSCGPGRKRPMRLATATIYVVLHIFSPYV